MAQSKNEVLLDQMVTILQGARTACEAISSNLEHGDHIKTTVDTKLKQSIDFIGGLTGKAYTANETGRVNFPPVTKMWGQTINPGGQKIAQQDLLPTLDEVSVFQNRRDQLYKSWETMGNTELGMIIVQPRGEALLRSVAYVAGYEHYDSDLINTEFFDKVREAIRAQTGKATAQEIAESAATIPAANNDVYQSVTDTAQEDKGTGIPITEPPLVDPVAQAALDAIAAAGIGGYAAGLEMQNIVTTEAGETDLKDTHLASPAENDKMAAEISKSEMTKAAENLATDTAQDKGTGKGSNRNKN